MRCGILTYHFVGNEGALWQAHALCHYLRAQFCEHTFEIIDYRHATKHQSIRAMGNPAALARRESVIAGFMGPERIESDGPGELFQMLKRRYDAVIVGSDVVWQFDRPRSFFSRWRAAGEKVGGLRPSRQSAYAYARDVKNWGRRIWQAATRPDPRRIPFPNAYWLSPELPQRKAAFAVSIGYSNYRRIPAALRETMRHYLEAFDFISVRDQSTQSFLAAVDARLGQRAQLTPDPAWLFEAELPDVEGLLRRFGIEPGRRYAGVLFPPRGFFGERLLQWIMPALRERGFRTVSVIDPNPGTDIDLASEILTPFEWWSVIRSLDFLFTVRTHPSIAALMYGTPLCNVDITAMLNRSAHSKSMDMLETFGLGGVCRFKWNEFTQESVVRCLQEALDRPWDWEAIGAQAARNRRRCREMAASMMEKLAGAPPAIVSLGDGRA